MTPARSVLRRGLQQSQRFVCWRCQQTRGITQNFLKRKEDGRIQWAAFATEIRAKKRQSMLAILEERGFVHAIAGERNAVDRLMIDKRIGAYVGIDPTASSLHVGHILPLMALFWMYLHGFHAVSLIGASTARIGDPTGRTTDRPIMTPTERKANAASMHYQIKRLWLNVERVGAKYGYKWEAHWHRELTNNAVWWNALPFLDVLKVLGRGLRLGTMLSRDTVKTKMESGDGMSFAEFCYPIMQAWDWWRMYDEKGIQMQIGGGDQYGNIVAGIDAVKYIAKSHVDPLIRQEGGVTELTAPYGFTVPLLTTASGEKFGKSAGNAIWLDEQKTSVFDLYGFFIRTADADVERYLKLFTFLPLPDIQSLMDKHKSDPSKRIPHHKLAMEFVELVHGPDAAKNTEEQHRALFQKPKMSDLNASHPSPNKSKASNPFATNQSPDKRLISTFLTRNLNKFAQPDTANSSPPLNVILPKSIVYNQPIARVLFAAGLVSSRSEGHRLAENKGAYIGRRASDAEQMSDDLSFVPAKLHQPDQTWKYVIRDDETSLAMQKEGEEGVLILRVGKWKIRVIRVVSDEKFEQLGIEGPQGWKEMKAAAAAQRQKLSLETQTRQLAKEDKVELKAGRSKMEWAAFKEQERQGLEYLRARAESDRGYRTSEADPQNTKELGQEAINDVKEAERPELGTPTSMETTKAFESNKDTKDAIKELLGSLERPRKPASASERPQRAIPSSNGSISPPPERDVIGGFRTRKVMSQRGSATDMMHTQHMLSNTPPSPFATTTSDNVRADRVDLPGILVGDMPHLSKQRRTSAVEGRGSGYARSAQLTDRRQGSGMATNTSVLKARALPKRAQPAHFGRGNVRARIQRPRDR